MTIPHDRYAMRCAAVTAVALAAPTWAGTIYVPADEPSIGAAIAVARNGDLVLVADGTYSGPGNRDLSFGGRAITVRSENGPAACVIDCQRLGRAFIFDSGEPPAAVLDGFTITNGLAATGNGGGVDIALGSSPTIRRCVLRGNRAIALGGGMAVRGQCAPLIEECTFVDNVAFGTEESAEGGGLCLFFLSPATVRSCVFVRNFSEYGGGLSCALSDATITNCLFVENEAAIGGGGVACDVASPRLVNCTVANNRAQYGGGLAGISTILACEPRIDNCILWGDGPDEIVILNGEAQVRYSDVRGGWPGQGNIARDPAFVGESGPGGAGYRVGAGSPCIDAADNTGVPEGITADLDGNPRFVDDPDTEDTGRGGPPVVDMGAYEFQGTSCPADLDGSGVVDFGDVLIVLAAWGNTGGPEDLDDSGVVDFGDILAVLVAWGPCPQ